MIERPTDKTPKAPTPVSDSPGEELETVEVTLSDGRVAVMVEPMGGADMILQGFDEDDEHNVEVIVKYTHATCRTIDGEPPTFEAIAAMSRYDRHIMLKRNRQNPKTFGDTVEFDLTCVKDPKTKTGCGQESKAVVALSGILETVPEIGLLESRHPTLGVVTLKPITMEVEQALQNIDETTDILAMRVMIVDGKPYGTMRQWPSRKNKILRAMIQRLDGEPGLTTTVTCGVHGCGKQHRISMLTVPDFFAL